MNILVTGINGFVGKSLIGALLEHQYQVVGAVRNQGKLVANVKQFAVGDIDANTNYATSLSCVDTVVHLAARVHIMNDHALDPLAEFRKVNVDGTLNLARQAAKAGVRRFIFISSVKVNGEFTLSPSPSPTSGRGGATAFSEADIPNPQDAYGISKLEAEQGLLKIAQETGMEVVIIRPPLIYGPGVKANFASLLRVVRKGLPLPLGAIHNKRSFIYVENLVSFILHCIHHPLAANQILLVSDGQDLSTTELLKECAKALGVRAWLLPLPQKLIEVAAALIGKKDVAQRLCGNLQVDITKARELLGWNPPYSVADGLKATVLRLPQGE